eukprot:gene1496-biopygen14353
MNSLMLLVAKILGVKSEGADSDVFALMEGAMNVMGIHNLLPQSARRVDIAEVATELLSGDQILIRTAGSKERFHHGIFVGPISGVQGGKNLVVDFWGSQDAGKQEAKIRLRTLGEFMAVPGWPELADDSFKEESNASEEPMTTTVEDYDALLRELENCRIKNQTLIKHKDELKLISETTMHENILLKSQLVPELSPYHFGHDLLTSLNLPFCNTKCCIVLLDSSRARQCKKNRQATGLLCTTHASSPKHVAEKVNKAYATRCFERHAKVISASQTQSDCVTAYTSACDDNKMTAKGCFSCKNATVNGFNITNQFQTYGIGELDSNGDILLRGNLRISETANIYKGYTHAMYMTSNGIVVSAGSDANGQLGRGTSSANVVINANIVPMLMPDGSNVYARAISAGGYHSAVLLNNGSAYLCGKNDQGQCGASPTLVPQANSLGIISTLSNVVDVACGHEHTLFTRYDGQVLGFGRNDRGQLGQGNKTSPVTSVVQVLAGGGAGSSNGLSVEIAAGFNHSACIKNDNTVFVFGANDKGQLGLGQTTTESLTPTQLVGYAGYDIACGRNHTVISTTPDPLTFNYTGNNALIVFGDNAYGQVVNDPGLPPEACPGFIASLMLVPQLPVQPALAQPVQPALAPVQPALATSTASTSTNKASSSTNTASTSTGTRWSYAGSGAGPCC